MIGHFLVDWTSLLTRQLTNCVASFLYGQAHYHYSEGSQRDSAFIVALKYDLFG